MTGEMHTAKGLRDPFSSLGKEKRKMTKNNHRDTSENLFCTTTCNVLLFGKGGRQKTLAGDWTNRESVYDQWRELVNNRAHQHTTLIGGKKMSCHGEKFQLL